MGKLPPQKKILKEDLKGAPSWINPLIDTVNNFMETTYSLFNKNITDTENIACQIKDIIYKTTSAYPVADVLEFQSELKTKATGLLVLQLQGQFMRLGSTATEQYKFLQSRDFRLRKLISFGSS